MALPKTETFTGSDNDALPAGWTKYTPGDGCYIRSNAFAQSVSAASYGCYLWTGDTFNAAQYVTATQLSISQAAGVAVLGGASQRPYCFGIRDATRLRFFDDTGANTKTWTGTYSANKVVRLETDGSGNFTAYYDGVQQTDEIPDDTTFTSGSAGVWSSQGTNVAAMDDWEGGNMGGGAVWPHPPRALNGPFVGPLKGVTL